MVAASTSPDREAFQLLRAGRPAEALPFAERAVAGARACMPAHGLLATILARLGRAADAEAVVAEAISLGTGVPDAYDALAYVSIALGRHDRARELYRQAADLAPHTPRYWYNLACCERNVGRLAEAEAACGRAIAADTTQYPSYLLRSELRVQTPEFNHVRELQALLGRTGSDDRAQMFLGYALGKELDDLRRYDEAFEWFAKAARTRRSHLAYDVAADEGKMKRIIEVFPAGRSPQASWRDTPPRDIFIVGLPRSGTTLVERILTGLPGVRSNGETDNFMRALLAAAPNEGGDVFARAAAADPYAVATGYSALAHPAGSLDVLVEKLPMNYLYLGAIGRALPSARILWVRRTAIDSCFAMYRTLFGEAYPFTYDFDDLARYYAAYERLMEHWRAALGDRLHEVNYEDLVREPARHGAAIAAACGLAWSPSAVEIQNNTAASLTASAAQVRRPIYGTSSGRWRHYRRHLEPLFANLRRYGVALRDDAEVRHP